MYSLTFWNVIQKGEMNMFSDFARVHYLELYFAVILKGVFPSSVHLFVLFFIVCLQFIKPRQI